MKASCLLWLTLAIVCTATVSACSGREKTKAPAGTAASTPDAHHTQPVGIDACVQEKYPGCHILDHDTDNGLTEVKISHEGREKILIFDGGQWIRTLWELQRDELPPHIVNALGAAGFAFHDIDDNDNSAADTQDGRFYAVQAKRRGREGIFIVTDDGNIVQRATQATHGTTTACAATIGPDCTGRTVTTASTREMADGTPDTSVLRGTTMAKTDLMKATTSGPEKP